MATGIDGEAHIGALEAGGETIAVCGTGLDRIYPAKHRALAHKIFEQGAVLVRDTQDILNELSFEFEPCIPLIKQYNGEKDVDNEASELLQFLSYEAISVDELVEKSKLSPQVVSQMLLILELSNRVSRVGVATFVLI